VNHQIALSFEDGVTRFVTSLLDERVADAAYRSGINIPLDCREGACGTCKAFCESGRFLMSDYVDEALTADEAARGFVLTCRMTPLSDCVVQIPATSAVAKASAASTFTANIVSVKNLSPTAFVLTLHGSAIECLKFLPGQYANLCLPGSNETRAYSFSSLVHDGTVSFLIRNVPQGRMSRYLTERARPGDPIRFQAPFGSFYFRQTGRPVVMIAGGTGLAPFLAMLEYIGVNRLAIPVHLVYGVTNEEDLVALDELEVHTRNLAGQLDITVCVANAATPGRNKGFVTDHLVPEMFHGGDVDLYLCGPPPMVAAVEAFLNERRLKPVQMHYEKFLPSK